MKWYPRVLWVGIGCQGGTSRDVIESAIKQVCCNYDLAESEIAGIATIDTKADEVGLIELCQGRNWQLKTFSAEVLNSIPTIGFNVETVEFKNIKFNVWDVGG